MQIISIRLGEYDGAGRTDAVHGQLRTAVAVKRVAGKLLRARGRGALARAGKAVVG